ncbi:unnamed protein product [Diatraea saccharalis]|uniref:DNA topoisomerase (ATP-hydrolyzing) n=1 Tax=Diatraea saccharalis TaxID=40085 RepID=A0A9N9QW36_9NEOP|nr:unnamed protein product [Diatraea saccharalis]
MDLLNNGLSGVMRDWQMNNVVSFKQDSKLVEAIDKLFYCNSPRSGRSKETAEILLPDRRLTFDEVQRILQEEKHSEIINDCKERKSGIIKKIEDILDVINKTAENGDTPKLIIRNQRLWSNCIYDLERELFYQNVSRVRNQANLDVAVRDVCCLLESPPWSLGIVATAKGLIVGSITLRYGNGTIIDCSKTGGVLVPQDVEGIKEFKCSAKYILVVEKDAIFQKLLDEGALIRLGPVIIITFALTTNLPELMLSLTKLFLFEGKGYPDVCTRRLLCRLCSELRLQALALVDADPHGYEIFLTYKYGSLVIINNANSKVCTDLSRLPSLTHAMEITVATNNERKNMNKAKSCVNGPSASAGPRLKNEVAKRKSLYANEAVKSLDLALGRLKKTKLSHGENSQTMPNRREGSLGMFIDSHSKFTFNQGIENASNISMNFSHYELIRNLSESNCYSDDAFSGTTGERCASPADLTMKDEHLEKYFRSIEMWSAKYKMDGSSNLHLRLPE